MSSDEKHPEGFRLSPQQRRLWLLRSGESAPSRSVCVVDLEGELDRNVLSAALGRVVAEHEILRTSYQSRGQKKVPVQIIDPNRAIDLSASEGKDRDSAETEAQIRRWLQATEDRGEGESADRFYGLLISCSPRVHRLCLRLAGYSCDGAGLRNLVREIARAYHEESSGTAPSLGSREGSIQYADLAEWLNAILEDEETSAGRSFWSDRQYSEHLGVSIPFERSREGASFFESIQFTSTKDQEMTSWCRSQGYPLPSVLLAAWQVLLGRMTGGDDVVVAFEGDGRNHPELEGSVGLFARHLPLFCRLDDDLPFEDLVARTTVKIEEIEKRQEYYGWEEGVDADARDGAERFYPFAFRHEASTNRIAAGDLTFTIERSEAHVDRFKLKLSVSSIDQERIRVDLYYDSELFDRATVVCLLNRLQALLAGVRADPGRTLGEFDVLDTSERRRILGDWNATDAIVPEDLCVHELFEAQVRRTPEEVAVTSEEGQFSFRELNHEANRIAHELRERGVGPETTVGICLDRSFFMVAAIFGVLKSGGAYVPLDSNQPPKRQATIITDSGARLVLTRERFLDRFTGLDLPLVCVDLDAASIGSRSGEDLVSGALPENLAYVMYTSGSTGRPKGVMIHHRGLVNYLTWSARAYRVEEGRGTAVHSPISFDLTITALVCPLLAGQCVHLLQDEIDVASLGEMLIRREDYSLLKITPTHLELLGRQLSQDEVARLSRCLVIGGEALLAENLTFWREHAPGTRLINEYGPTETVVGCCVHEVSSDSDLSGGIPIGRPIDNMQLYVLDRRLEPVPPGVTGELYLAGAQLARGYRGASDLTADRFLPNPFSKEPGARMYRSGDLARYRADGVMEYFGRADYQVKIRGHRIELGEVEAALAGHPAVCGAVVNLRSDPTVGQRLVGYLTLLSQDGPRLTVSDLHAYLKDCLPDVMVPGAFVFLESLPLTRNGKVDRQALPNPDSGRPELDRSFVAPSRPEEELMVEIWGAVLGLDRVGIHDDFFELGGDSILSLQIVARANQVGLQITPRQIFDHPTISELASVAGTRGPAPAERGEVTGSAPLTPIQHWFFRQELADPHHFNQATLLEVREDVDPALVREVARELVRHHDALRLRFDRDESGWRQIGGAIEDQEILRTVDLSALSGPEREDRLVAIVAEEQSRLNLSEGPLILLVFFEMGEGRKNRLFLVVHHLVFDGVSWRILLEDFQSAYIQASQGETVRLPSKTTSYFEWANRLEAYASEEHVEAELAYWTNEKRLQVTGLPLGDADADATMTSADTVAVSMTREETGWLLHDVSNAYRTNIDDVLLTALVLAFEAWTGQSSLLVDLERHGREDLFEDVDLSRTVGWFTAVVPVLLDVNGVEGAGEALKSIKEQLRGVPASGIGYGLLRYLHPSPTVRDRMHDLPKAEVSFNYLGQLDQTLPADSFFSLASESQGPSRSLRGRRTHRININALIRGGKFQIAFQYNEGVHSRATIERIASDFEASLRDLIAHCRSSEAGGYTPSDYPLARIDQATLDRLFGSDRGIEDIYPLSPTQQGMLFHSLYEPRAGLYFEHFCCTVTGELDVDSFKKAWDCVIARHSILRTSFHWEGLEKPLQVVHANARVDWEEQDWSDDSSETQVRRFEEFLVRDRERGLELSKAPVMRCTLVRRAGRTSQFIWSYHHLLLDGWATPLLLKEIMIFYRGEREQEEHLERPRSYGDYIAWLDDQETESARAYWRRCLNGFTSPIQLGVGPSASHSAEEKNACGQSRLLVSAPLTASLRSLARRNQLTLNTIVQGAWSLLIGRYADAKDVVYGVTVSGRPALLPGVDSMVGLFINTLPVRVTIDRREPLLPWLKRLQSDQLEMRQFEHTPLVDVQAVSELPPGVPLFENIFVFENYPIDESLRTTDARVDFRRTVTVERTNYQLSLVVVPGEELSLRLTYRSARFPADTIDRMLDHLKTLLESMSTDPEQALGELQFWSRAARNELESWNETTRPRVADQTIHRGIEEQVKSTPDALALEFGSTRMTFGELDRRANAVAHHLRDLGVGPDTPVGILAERSVELVVGMVGVLKAGGAYLPLDPRFPRERLRFMLEDGAVPFVLVQERLRSQVPRTGARAVILEEIGQRELADPPDDVVTSDNLAYIMYTSGSTGKPKAVEIEHRSVVNNLEWKVEDFPLDSSDRVLQKTPMIFDASVWEFFLPLWCGVPMVLAEPDGHKDPAVLLEMIRDHQITIVQVVPTQLESLIQCERLADCRTVRRVFCGGEPLLRELVNRFFERLDSELINLYGPTEACIDSLFWRCRRGESSVVPIGGSVPNSQVHILGRDLKVMPIGAPGEIYIGGTCLARGYRNRPELTAERFVPDPIRKDSGERFYSTGDRARRLSDGSVEFLGRADHQVKLRGHRIELEEIRCVLLEHPRVGEAAVCLRGSGTSTERLVAYVTFVGGDKPSARELIEFLSDRLPEVMVPHVYVELERFPLTPSGKIDRRSLPVEDEGSTLSKPGYVAARTPHEEIVAGIWRQVLGVERVGVLDSFFELGGHSLLATQVFSRLRQVFRVDLPIRVLFDAPTVESLAIRLQSVAEVRLEIPPMVHLERAGTATLSYAQQRLWFLEQLESDRPSYNVTGGFLVDGPLNIDAFVQAASEILCRHEVLRTTFEEKSGQPRQVIHEAEPFPLSVVDMSDLDEAKRTGKVQDVLFAESSRRFDLRRGPLLRGTLLRFGPQNHAVVFSMHHIVSDGWSLGVLVRELSVLYEACSAGLSSPLPDLPVQYADFARWQRESLGGSILDAHLSYWKRKLGGELPVLKLPSSRKGSVSGTRLSANEKRLLSAEITMKVKSLSQREGVTVYMTLLAGLQALLHRCTGQDDIVVGTDIANRNRVELEGLIGFFVNILVLRVNLGGNPSFREALGRVREVTMGAFAHQDLPFDRLVEELQPKRYASGVPLFQVLFVYQNTPAEPLRLSGTTLTPLAAANQRARFDLVLFVSETEGQLVMNWTYDTDIFDAQDVIRLASQFETLLASALRRPDSRLSKLEMLSGQEMERRRMDRKQKKQTGISKLKSIKPVAVNLNEIELVRTGLLEPGKTMPLVVEPTLPDVDLAAWAESHHDRLESDLCRHGAVLFRGFNTDLSVFERLAGGMVDELFREYGDLPKEKDSDRVYHSTPYPEDQIIEFHSESSHLRCWPRKIFFMCMVPAKEQGETPLVDCRKVFQRLPESMREEFCEKGLRYVRNFTPNLDVSWQAFFGTSDRAVVEEFCRANGIDFEWRDGERLMTSNAALAVAKHPKTGEATFFNQIQLHHLACLPTQYRESTRRNFAEEDLPRHVFFGDGTVIEDSVVEMVRRIYWEEAILFQWKAGDIVMIDNMLTAHARMPYVGPRKIVVALGEMIQLDHVRCEKPITNINSSD